MTNAIALSLANATIVPPKIFRGYFSGQFTRFFIPGVLATMSLTSLAFAQRQTVDLVDRRCGVEVIENFSGTPDDQGILERYSLRLPQSKQAVYYRGTWWPYGGNRVYGERLDNQSLEGGLFSILQLESGDYLAILPLCGEQAYAWLAPQHGVLHLHWGTRGTGSVSGDMPLVSWSRSSSPYEAANTAWQQATETPQIKGWMKMREAKTYPDVFKYLGWCSWEEFKKKISAEKLTSIFKALEASELPIRYMLVDDGHFSSETLMPIESTFPDGYQSLVRMRNEEGIKWVGMWHALLGNANAMLPGNPQAINKVMLRMHNGRSVPQPDAESIETFMRYLFSPSKRDGVDFVKVDFCGTLLPYYAGTKSTQPTAPFPSTNQYAIANPSAATVLYSRIYQQVAAEEFQGLLNCNWHVPHFIFNSCDSVAGRCGPDYKLTVERARMSIFNSYSSMAWLGQIAWGDHDMFHSSDKLAARMMAVSKALSGGLTYLSDNPAHLVPSQVWPLCYLDGRLLRPLAPGAPLPEDLFMNQGDARLYRTMAPLANHSVAFACYNLQGDGNSSQPELKTRITKSHYQSATGMIQPYPGRWKLPGEGLIVYDHQTKTAQQLTDDGYEVSISGFGESLIQFSPIEHGWSVIGRTDKYLSAAAVEIIAGNEEQLQLKLVESGPFAIWLDKGTPAAEGITFTDQGNGLFAASLPVKAESAVITVQR